MSKTLQSLAIAAYRFQRFFHRLFHPVTLGVAAIVVNSDDEVLLVKPTYKKGWYLPGGGVKRGETVYQAMERELYEETGIKANIGPEDLRSVFYHEVDCKHDHVSLFVVNDWEQQGPKTDVFEIADIEFFNRDRLPPDTSSSVDRQIKAYFESEPASIDW